MALAPLLFVINEKVVQPRFLRAKPKHEPDAMESSDIP